MWEFGLCWDYNALNTPFQLKTFIWDPSSCFLVGCLKTSRLNDLPNALNSTLPSMILRLAKYFPVFTSFINRSSMNSEPAFFNTMQSLKDNITLLDFSLSDRSVTRTSPYLLVSLYRRLICKWIQDIGWEITGFNWWSFGVGGAFMANVNHPLSM